MMKQFSYRHTKEAELMDSMEQAAKGAPQTDEELFSFAGFNEAEVERTGYSNYSYWSSTFRAFLKNKGAVVLLVLLFLLLAFTFIQPHLPGQYDPNTIVNDEAGMQYRNIPPGDQFILGTNSIGQDLWARIWAGTRTSLLIGLSVALAEALIGITVGVIWGYVRKADFILTEIYNIIDNIPNTIVLILISYILKPGVKTLIFAMCLTGWIQMARFIRNQILIIRDRDYNVASRCLGTPTAKIIIKNLLPYLVSVIMLRMALTIPSAIGNEVFITYIGLGLPVNIPSLGNLINEGRALITSPALRYQLVYPTIILSFVTISFYIIGNAFSDAADPKNHV
ncbi:MAG: ABC transporter permease [Clostridiaceae bacterium]|nr:ABC transporter permease [Clostridiaceae bacterium]